MKEIKEKEILGIYIGPILEGKKEAYQEVLELISNKLGVLFERRETEQGEDSIPEILYRIEEYKYLGEEIQKWKESLR